MARVQLENRLGVPIYRTFFTGAAYTLEPPVMIPPNATVFWQTDDTGSVTYSAIPRGGRSTGATAVTGYPVATYPPVPTSPPAASQPVAPGVPTLSAGASDASPAADASTATYTIPVLDVPPVPAASAVAITPVTGPQPVIVPPPGGYMLPVMDTQMTGAPTNPRAAVRPFTLAWQFSPTGRPRFFTRSVATGLRLSVRETFDGALYTVSSRRRRFAPARPHRRILTVVSALLASLLLLTTAGAVAYGVSGAHFLNGFRDALPFGKPHAAARGAIAAPTISLTASQTGVPVGTAVTLIATTNGAIPGGYAVDIAALSGASALSPSPCAIGAGCIATVSYTSPTSMTYQAYIEKSYQSGVLATSTSVTVSWLPPSAPTRITLSASPGADSSGTVKVENGATVTLTATTDLNVETAHYQIVIEDTSGHKAGAPCKKGKTCTATVRRSSAGSVTYVAYAKPTTQGSQSNVRLPSSPITVIWSSPPPPGSITLTADPGPDTSGAVNVANGKTVTLTASASSSLSYTGYEIAIFDTNGNRVGAPCASGAICTARVSSAVSASLVYIAHIEQGNLSGIKATSNTIAVIWSPPLPPRSVSLVASTLNPAWGADVTLTADTQGVPVDNTGYIIQIVDLTDGVTEIKYCDTGSSCAITLSNPNTGTSALNILYESYVDQGNPYIWVATSPAITVTWPSRPAPGVTIRADSTEGNNNPVSVVGSGTLSILNGTTVIITATADYPLDGTGYELVIIGGGSPVCSTGSACTWSGSYADYSIDFRAQIVRISDNTVVSTSGTITVTWYHIIQ